MASVGGVYSETLHSITATKLEELSQKRATFEEQYRALQEAAAVETDRLKRVIILVDGVKRCFQVRTKPEKIKGPNGSERLGHVDNSATDTHRLETDLRILDRFLEQARFDPSISAERLSEWEQKLQEYLGRQSDQYAYAALYGQLVGEWLSSEQRLSDMTATSQATSARTRPDAGVAWEQVAFTSRDVDPAAIERYLDELFGRADNEDISDLHSSLVNLRKTVQNFGFSLMSPNQFNHSTLMWVINGLQSSDLLSDEKRDVLKYFLTNPIILTEIADVLNMRMAALDHWTWGPQVSVEQRRKINGTYSIHFEEDLLQAIFLHFIGIKWSVLFKESFKALRKYRNVWKKLGKSMPREDRNRRGYYLGPQYTKGSLNNHRFREWRKNYFLFQLPDNEHQNIEFNDGEEEAELGDVSRRRTQQIARNGGPPPRPMVASKAARMSMPSTTILPAKRRRLTPSEQVESDSEDDDGDSRLPKRPMDAKQRLLHLLSTEIVTYTGIYGEASCFRSAFEDWNSQLPHDTILTVLKFFGMPNNWLNFFQRFLQAPLKFSDDNAEPRIRRCGMPGAHSISDIFGEAVLFCLDFAINQSTDGSLLYRINEDFWFWSGEHMKSVRAWQAAEHFTKVMGVKLNSTKTGSVRISADTNVELSVSPLPQGDIRWGFLYLNPKTGVFDIDEIMIENHIKDLGQQLRAKDRSIFSWIQAWNTYATTFFTANFGKVANCFGRLHVDRILEAHEHVNLVLFPIDGSITEYLRRLIKERFGIDDVPDGFLFFPVELGGLGLLNPFVGPLQIRDAVLENPLSLLQEFERDERQSYLLAKERFDNGEIAEMRYAVADPNWKPLEGKDDFMSFAEFVKYREDLDYEFDGQLRDVFIKLLLNPDEEAINATQDVLNAISALSPQTSLKGITSHWYSMEPYWKWVAQMYGPEMIRKFGGLNVVEPGLLPVGMVSLFQGKRATW